MSEKRNDVIKQADDMAKELVKFSERINFNEEMFLDIIQESIAPAEEFFSYYACAIMEVETKFKVLNEMFSLKYDGNPIENITSRVKDYDSIIRKVIKKNIPRDLTSIEENIHDIAGVRVICSFVEDIYRLAKCLLQQDDVTLISEKDYIKNPKPRCYRILNLIISVPIFLENEKKDVKVEVQLRTIAMDFWASLEHKLKYKKNLPEEKKDILSQELIDCANESALLDQRMQKVRNIILNGE